MRALKAFVLGALAVGVVAYALVAALAVTAQAGGRTLDISLGPLTLVVRHAERNDDGDDVWCRSRRPGSRRRSRQCPRGRRAIRNRSGGRGDRVD